MSRPDLLLYAARRPRRVLFGFLVVAAMVLAGVLWAMWPDNAITRENAAKIEHGMTLTEVEALLGGPERIEAAGPHEGDADNDTGGPDGAEIATERFETALTTLAQCRRAHVGAVTRAWGSDEAAIFIAFDVNERVIAVAVRPLRRAAESPLDILRRWLGL